MEKQHSAFILGAGYLGLPLAWQLHRHGIEVVGTRTGADNSLPFAIEKWHADGDDASLRLADVWVFLLPPNVSQDYAATVQRCVRLAEKWGVAHFILGSSTGVYGNAEQICDEETALNPQSKNAHQIVRAEEYVLNSHLPHRDILRFAGLFDDERHPIRYLVRSDKPIQAASSKVNLIHRADAVAALYYACLNPQGCRIRNIVAPEHPSRGDFYRHEATRLNCPMPAIAEEETINHIRMVVSRYADFPTPTNPILA